MIAWIQAHGGFEAVAVVSVICFNIVMSALAQLFATLKQTEPAFLQNLGNWGLKISQYLTANTPTPKS